MRYRVEQLAAACDVSVDTVRYYQSRGLVPPPAREGRVAVYGKQHADRIRRIRSLQRQGLTLAAIGRVLDGKGLRGADRKLVEALTSAQADGDEEEFLTLEQLAQRSGVPASLLQAVEREGLPLARDIDGQQRYTTADVQIVQVALRLLEAGLPLGELLALARQHHEVMQPVAQRAVEMFDTHVRRPIRDAASTEEEAAEQLVAAFRELLPAVTKLVSHHFRRVLLAAAEDHIEAVGGAAELEAKRAESRRRLEVV